MKIIDKKPAEISENVFYGVNIQDKQAVEREFLRLRKKHRNITIITVILLAIIGVFIVDFCRVNFFDAKPILAIPKKVENGTLFTGLGYEVLYCTNGDKYIGSVQFQTCGNTTSVDTTNFVYEQLMNYAREEKLLDEKKLDYLTINSVTLDGTNKQKGADYFVNLSYQCKNDSVTCFKTPMEYYDINNVNLYVRFNRYNEVYDIIHFKKSGIYYDSLVTEYTEKIKTYFIENEMYVEDNIREFKVNIIDNSGKFKFRNAVYADSYLIQINYLCLDNTNTCVKAIDNKDNEGDYANLSFYASMFVDSERNILLIGPREYLDL